uniref:ATP-binding protein n=1 Tax=Algoriphagus locisalis TaxID=305507 RepID=UPI001113727B|nr:ATP-binding protein [Algoriphagus locisalis]
MNLNVENQPVKNYLQAIGLLEVCSPNHFSNNELFQISDYTAMPLHRVNQENMTEYILKTQALFQTFCPEKDLGVLQIALSELINNVYDHSESPFDCLVFCQYYAKQRNIVIAVADLGYGIPLIVNRFLESHGMRKLPQFDAVGWALKLNQTTKSEPHNAGKGLDTIASFIQAIDGTWKLFSDEVKMESSQSGNQFLPNPIQNFTGTVIEISIKVDNLSDIETVEVLEW